MSLTDLAVRSLRARPLRAVLSSLGIALGVAVLFAGLATRAGLDASVDATVRDQVGRADLQVAALGENGLSNDTVERIAGTPGVAVVAPSLEHRTYLADGSGSLPPPVTILGIDPAASAELHDLVLIAGAGLTGPDDRTALITERLAEEDGLGIGSTLTMQAAGDVTTVIVVGMVPGAGPLADPLGRTVLVPLRVAQTAFAETGATRVEIGLAAGADPAAVSAELETRLLAEPYVLSTPGDLAASLRASTVDFGTTTALIAAIALFAGAFLVFNTMSMTVSERLRELGLLRAAGARRGQIMRFVLSQALILGIAGSLAGIVLGSLFAVGIAGFVGAIGSVPLAQPVLPVDAMALAVVIGVALTLAAAFEPARRASRLQPVEALSRRHARGGGLTLRLRWVALVFVAVAVVGVIIVPRAAGDSGVVQAVSVYAVLLVATMLIPFILPAIARAAGIPFALLLRVEERMARTSIVRDRSRTTLTLGGLTVGLAMIVALGGVGGHARAAAAGWIAAVVPGDVVVTSIRPIASDEGVGEELAGAVPGVASVSPIGTFDVAVRGSRTEAAAVVGADMAADGRLTFIAGDRTTALAALDAGGATVVPASLADRFGLAVGQTIALPTADGGRLDLLVAGIVERSIPGRSGEAMLIGWPDATTHLGVAGADLFAVRFEAGAPASVQDALRTRATALALEVVPLDRIEGAINAALGRIFSVFDVLAVIAVLIATLGIVNTLTVSVLERVREIGILRATGMTRGQVWRSVVVEAGVLGLSGAVLGIAVGLIVGALMVVLAGGRLDVAGIVPWSIISLALGIGVAASMLAAAYPARIASRLSIVRAVTYE